MQEVAAVVRPERNPMVRFRLALAGVVLLLLSACRVEMDIATHVEDDGSGQVAVTVMLGETARETLREKELKGGSPEEQAERIARGEDLFERGSNPVDILADDVPPSWEAERITEGHLEGLRLEAAFSDLNEVRPLLEELSDFGGELAERIGRAPERVGPATLVREFSITRDGPIFQFRGEPNAEEYEGATGGSNKLIGVFTISVDLPGGVTEHDADEEVDGALVWHIEPGTKRSISATSDLTKSPPGEFPTVPVAIGGSVIGIGGLLALRWFWERRRRGGGGEPPESGEHDEEPALV